MKLFLFNFITDIKSIINQVLINEKYEKDDTRFFTEK